MAGMEWKKGHGPLPLVIAEEIALDGLEGLTIDGLWKRLSPVLKIELPFLENFQGQIWNFIKKSNSLFQCFELPEPREKLKTGNRMDYRDADIGEYILPEECPFPKYPLHPVEDGEIRGSCQYYKKRKKIEYDELKDMTLDEVLGRWGDKFVIVASQSLRERFLIPETAHLPKDFSLNHYCILEAIGRSRYNGEVTSGRFSMLHMFKDSALLFYVKNKLFEYKFVLKQPYYEKIGTRIYSGQILTLPKFYTELKSKPMCLIETIFKLIKTQQSGFMSSTDVLQNISAESRVNLKKLKHLAIFKKFFDAVKVSHREIYPNSNPSEYMQKNKIKERIIGGWKLKDPNMKIEDLWTDDDNKEEEEIEFLNPDSYYLDMPLQNQVYKLIEDSGTKGVSQTMLTKSTGINRYSIRAIIKKLVQEGSIKTFMEDFGRQRTGMYTTAQNGVLRESNILPEVSEKLSAFEETLNEVVDQPDKIMEEALNTSTPEDETIAGMVDIKEARNTEDFLLIEATIRDLSEPVYKIDPSREEKRLTSRYLDRKNLCLAIIKRKGLVDTANLYRVIKNTELKRGFKGELCRKSLMRIVHLLIHTKECRGYEIVLSKADYARVYKYVTLPSLLSSDDLFQEELKKIKTLFYLTLLDKKSKNKEAGKQVAETDEEIKGTLEISKSKVPKAKVSKDLPKQPKFLRAQSHHEFLVYITYELPRKSEPIPVTEHILKKWKRENMEVDTDDLLTDMPPLYSEEISWKMFIPPLSEYKEVSYGWILFQDIIARFPLSLVAKSSWVRRSSDNLIEKYLSHPIRQHYLIHNLPDVASELYAQNVQFGQIDDVIRNLGAMGLVQVGHRVHKELIKSWLYVCKHGKLMDTSTSEAAYHKVTPKEYPTQIFEFNSTQDTINYWNILYKIVSTTKLGYNKKSVTGVKRKRYINELVPVKFEEAVEKDVGYVPGDNLGAAGLDSNMFAHLKRNWSWRIKQSSSQPKCRPIATSSKIKKMKRGEIQAPKKVIKLKVGGKRVVGKWREIMDVKLKKIRKEYDEIDKEALKKMKSLRVNWSPEEDRMLKICRAVFHYLQDPHAIRVVKYTTVRDILQWSIAALNKTTRACHRRTIFLSRYKRDLPDTPAWLHELRHNQYITKLYGPKFIRDLRTLYSDDAEYAPALRVHFVKLVSYLIKILNHASLSTENEIILPDTLSQFNMLYQCSPSNVSEDRLKHLQPKTWKEIEMYTISGLIHSSVCCVKDKTLYNIQLFEIYKAYTEDTLATAFNKARTDQLVVATKAKDIPSYSQKLVPMGPSLVLSVKYRQQLTFIHIPYNSMGELFTTFETFLNKNFVENDSFDFNAVDTGSYIFLSELCLLPNLSVEFQLPPRILTLDPHQEKCKDSERILEHFRRLFENAPKTEYIRHYEEKCKTGEHQPNVRFNIVNESYKLNYNPYDTLVNLSDDYIHFFCLLQNLNKEVYLKYETTEDGLCAFDCILKNGFYVSTIEEIITDKQRYLDLLALKNDDQPMEDRIRITPQNLMDVFCKQFNIAKLKSKGMNSKDFGRINLQPHTVDIITLAKELCEYLDQDFSITDGEYIPTLNKEDKIIKAQDIFVVNLPKIKLRYCPNENEETVKYKKLVVPSNIMRMSLDPEKVIEKVMREYIIPSQTSTIRDLIADMENEGLTAEEKTFTCEVLDFIDTNHLGVTNHRLLEHFKDEKSLTKSIAILRKHGMVMRAGVEIHTYVHKNHIRPWVIHTYHIKRLERETIRNNKLELPGKKVACDSDDEKEPLSKKRKLDVPEKEEVKESSSSSEKVKSFRNDEKEANDEKEIPSKRRKCSESGRGPKAEYTSGQEKYNKERETIVMRPCPWMRVNGSLNRRVLDKWMGSILLECISLNGVEVLTLCIRFNMLQPVNILFLLEILKDIGCIELNSKIVQKPTLFSIYKDPVIGVANEFTNIEDMFVTVQPDALTKYGIFIGDRKYKTDFI